MDKQTKKNIIVLIPLIFCIIIVGTLTNYNSLWITLAGAFGGLIGWLLTKVIK